MEGGAILKMGPRSVALLQPWSVLMSVACYHEGHVDSQGLGCCLGLLVSQGHATTGDMLGWVACAANWGHGLFQT